MNDSWKIIYKYFDHSTNFFAKHHIESYNDFVNSMIPRVIKSMNPITIYKYDSKQKDLKHQIDVIVNFNDSLKYDHPVIANYETDGQKQDDTQIMYPNDARLNDYSYTTNIYCDIKIVYKNIKKRTEDSTIFESIKIGTIPIMLHSDLCILKDKPNEILKEMGESLYDQGGYFIINGKEKVIISQERNITNKVFVNESKDEKYKIAAFIRCKSENESVFPKRVDFRVITDKSLPDEEKVDKTERKESALRKNAIIVRVPNIDTDIPLFILFRALGVESDKDIIEYIISGDVNGSQNDMIVDFLYSSVLDSNYVYTKSDALEYLAQFTSFKAKSQVEYILLKDFFPNIEYNIHRMHPQKNENENEKVNHSSKIIFLGQIVKHIVKVALGMERYTDKDNYMFKRIAISGFMLGDIFKDFYNEFRNNLRNLLDRKYNEGSYGEDLPKFIGHLDTKYLFVSDFISKGFMNSLRGQWGLERKQDGIVHDLSRTSFMSFMSHLMQVDSPIDQTLKLREPRRLNLSQYGMMCPVESPDGARIGLTKHFAYMCHITFNTSSAHVLQAIQKYFDLIYLEVISLNHLKHVRDEIKLTLNNTWIANVKNEDAPKLVHYLKLLRRNACINVFTSVSWNVEAKTISVFTEGARCCRPLIIVENQNEKQVTRIDKTRADLKNMSWAELFIGKSIDPKKFDWRNEEFYDPGQLFQETDLNKIMKKLEDNSSLLEFIDVEETNTITIAMTKNDLEERPEKIAKYTHCEIHPTTMFGFYACTIPLANHNHAPRNVFSAAQGKQAIGVYATNFRNRIDTASYILHYPQKRLVQSRYSDLIKMNDLPYGENLIVAIASTNGYNQEDSIIFNEDSVARGMFNVTSYKSYDSEEKEDKELNERVIFANPDILLSRGKNIKLKNGSYEKLDENGFPKENSFISKGDILVGKVRIKLNKKNNGQYAEMFQNEEEYEDISEIVDKTVYGKIDKVYVSRNHITGMRKLKLRIRKLKIPELGDKAASSHGQKGVCGLVVPAISLPYTKDGVKPDIIINPHAFPKRMTVGHILECALSRYVTKTGHFIDATPFDPNNHEYFYEQLENHGLDRHGNEIMYDGISGQQIETDIFIGPTYYYRMKHMVSDKINYRSTGIKQSLTMQPTQGRSNDGGLRIGEMEANAIVSHGMSGFMNESFMERSDGTYVFINEKDGKIIGLNAKEGHNHFTGEKDINSIYIPFAFKLLTQELESMSIKVTFPSQTR